jgi:DNA-binding XRE family transcriptional regulator
MPPARVVQVQHHLAANIRRSRARLGLTQEALAEKAGLGPVHLRNIERGVENVTLAIAPGRLLRKALLKPLRPGRPRTRQRAPHPPAKP